MVEANTEPWGTPDSSFTGLLMVWPILTWSVLSWRYVLRNLTSIAGSPSLIALWSTPVPQTLSNGFLASKSTIIVGAGWVARVAPV